MLTFLLIEKSHCPQVFWTSASRQCKDNYTLGWSGNSGKRRWKIFTGLLLTFSNSKWIWINICKPSKLFTLNYHFIQNGNWTEWWTGIWSEVVRVFSKSDERAAKIARRKVQLLLYYSHFEIAEFSQCQYIIHLVAGLLKREIKRLFYLFIFWTETMRYTAVAKMVWFKTELM